MVSQQDRRAQTRERILRAAQDLFIEQGYAATTTDMILKRARSSKGAMYHHFKSKAQMMEIIYAALSEQVIAAAISGYAPENSPLEGLKQAVFIWLEQIARPDTAPILLDQGPAVLGLHRAREIEERYSLGTMRRALEAAQAVGEIDVPDIDITARLLNALLAEAALLRRDTDSVTLVSLTATLDIFFEGLKMG